MAHFAQIDNNNTVQQVIVVSNDELLDNGVEQEAKGIEFCRSLYGADTNWVQTSYNARFRKHYAGIGYKYDVALDAFVAPQPFPSWILNVETCVWEAPVPYPQDGKPYIWDEATQSWLGANPS